MDTYRVLETNHLKIDVLEELRHKIAEANNAVAKALTEEQAKRLELDRLQQLLQKLQSPILLQLDEIETRKTKYTKEVHTLEEKLRELTTKLPYPTGPSSFHFVEHAVFDIWCNLVVICNLMQMVLQMSGDGDSHEHLYAILNLVFLGWYSVEISCKIFYLRKNFFLGQLSIVWSYYLDFVIVLSGILDLVLSDLFAGTIDTSIVKLLRFLRIFRLLRILKLVKAFFQSDLTWTEEANFTWVMTCVIGANSIVMALELDCEWAYWFVIENMFLLLYTFELIAKLKHWGCRFFYHPEDIIWNNLDFTIVLGAALDQWFVPLLKFITLCMKMKHGLNLESFGSFIQFLRLMRLLRVLRLVRLLKRIKPLYSLLMGVIQALDGMKWVIVLTGMLLYTCSIVFTTLVGKGLIFGSMEGHEDALEYYGTVADSLFSLFKMMNGDTEPLEPMGIVPTGKVLFVVFMVIANWSILAILTSVVSDEMISASARDKDDTERQEQERFESERRARIEYLFRQVDPNHIGTISAVEWEQMLRDEYTANELRDASGLNDSFLDDMFRVLAHDAIDETGKRTKNLSHAEFCEHMMDETKSASERSIMQLSAHCKALNSKVDSLFAHFKVNHVRKRRKSAATSV